jgi:hypothetical protein
MWPAYLTLPRDGPWHCTGEVVNLGANPGRICLIMEWSIDTFSSARQGTHRDLLYRSIFSVDIASVEDSFECEIFHHAAKCRLCFYSILSIASSPTFGDSGRPGKG